MYLHSLFLELRKSRVSEYSRRCTGEEKEGSDYFTPTGENQFMAFNAWFDYDPIKKLMAWGTLAFARGVRE